MSAFKNDVTVIDYYVDDNTTVKDKGLTVTELDNGKYLVRIQTASSSIEQTFSTLEDAKEWIAERTQFMDEV